MGNHRAKPKNPMNNDGQTSQGRGMTATFSATFASRPTGKKGSAKMKGNAQKDGTHVRTVSDPRLAD